MRVAESAHDHVDMGVCSHAYLHRYIAAYLSFLSVPQTIECMHMHLCTHARAHHTNHTHTFLSVPQTRVCVTQAQGEGATEQK